MKRKDFLRNFLTGIPLAGVAVSQAAGSLRLAGAPVDTTTTLRHVDKIVKSENMQVAPGFAIKRPLPSRGLNLIDPFLLLDQFGPTQIHPGKEPGVPAHPHRGFEPITFLFEGRAEHKDSQGNHAVLKGGDVQWMTAGAGIVHSEYMKLSKEGQSSPLHGVQLWVNLPKKHKMSQPGYQNLPAQKIPEVNLDENRVTVRVITGEAFGHSGPAKTFTAIQAMQVKIKPQGKVAIPVPAQHNALAYTLEGQTTFSEGQTAKASEMAVFRNDGNNIELSNSGLETANILFLSGAPINEPVASYGPFVMNSMQEIQQAYSDYKSGKMGKIDF